MAYLILPPETDLHPARLICFASVNFSGIVPIVSESNCDGNRTKVLLIHGIACH